MQHNMRQRQRERKPERKMERRNGLEEMKPATTKTPTIRDQRASQIVAALYAEGKSEAETVAALHREGYTSWTKSKVQTERRRIVKRDICRI